MLATLSRLYEVDGSGSISVQVEMVILDRVTKNWNSVMRQSSHHACLLQPRAIRFRLYSKNLLQFCQNLLQLLQHRFAFLPGSHSDPHTPFATNLIPSKPNNNTSILRQLFIHFIRSYIIRRRKVFGQYLHQQEIGMLLTEDLAYA